MKRCFRRGRRGGGGKWPVVMLAFAGALLCITFFSIKFLLVVLSIILVFIGVWMFYSC